MGDPMESQCLLKPGIALSLNAAACNNTLVPPASKSFASELYRSSSPTTHARGDMQTMKMRSVSIARLRAAAPLIRAPSASHKLCKPSGRLTTFRVHASADAIEAKPGGNGAVTLASPGSTALDAYGDDVSPSDLKAALLDSLYGTERGLSARSEIRAEINELISQLEAGSTLPSSSEVLDKLNEN
eukprot:gene2365-8673_t